MAQDDSMLDNLEFERRIGEMGDRELQEFTARESFHTHRVVRGHDKRIRNLEGKHRKALSISGGIGSMIGAAIIAIINYFTTKPPPTP